MESTGSIFNAMLEEFDVAARLLGCTEPCKLPHRPEPAAIAGGMDAAGEGKKAGIREIAIVFERRDGLAGIEPVDRTS